MNKNNQKVSDLTLISEEERYQILNVFNNTDTDYPQDRTIHELFEEQAERIPDNIAILFDDKKLTYRELNEKANRLARTLRKEGVGPDNIIGIMVERSIEMIVGIFGILKAGGAYLPIDPCYPKERIEFIVEDSRTDIVLTYDEFLDITNLSCKVINLNCEEYYCADASNLKKLNTSQSLAYVVYTSGSTGKPKGVMIEHYSVINRLNWMQKNYQIGESDWILQKTPFTFDVSVWELFWWSMVGSKCYLLLPGYEKDPRAIVKAIRENNITTMHFVPSMLNVFLEYIEGQACLEDLSSLKQVFSSGEALKVNQVKRFNKLLKPLGVKLHNLYGPTEATVDVTYFDCSIKDELDVIPIGKPIDNTKMYILDSENILLPIGQPGELHISGHGLARGYLNRPELTEEKFISNPFSPGEKLYKTGDLACWRPDGNIEYLGRIDHQVKIRGFRIELGEIENQLLSHKNIEEAIVIDREDSQENKYLCAYIIGDRDIPTPELKEYLLKKLPNYMIPSYFIQLDSIPLTLNGKADRKKLPEHNRNLTAGKGYAAPENEVQKKIASIWAKVLDLDVVGINDNFFDIGGQSLKAVTICDMCIRKGIDLPIPAITKYGTIAEICKNLSLDSNLPMDNVIKQEDNDTIVTFSEDKYKACINEDDYFWHSDSIKLELCIKDQEEVSTYCYRAYPLAIILAYNVYKSWYYQHFIQIYATATYNDGRIRIDYQEQEDFYIDIMDTLTISYNQLCEIGNIVLFIIQSLDNSHYVNINMDYYFRNLIIYGYDSLRGRFLAMSYNENYKAEFSYIDFKVMKTSFEKGTAFYKNHEGSEKEIVLRLFTMREVNHCYFDISVFINEINNYLNSWGNIEKIYINSSKNIKSEEQLKEKLVFGLDVTRLILETLENSTCSETLIDYSSLHLLAEHKKVMLMRLEFAAKYFDEQSHINMYIEKYRQIVNDFEGIYKLYLEMVNCIENSAKVRYCSNIIEIMKLSIQNEKKILLNIYNLYYRERAINSPQIIKNNSQTSEYGKCTKKVLKVSLQKDVNSYLYRAYPLCITFGDFKYLSWYNIHLIQICAQTFEDGYTLLDYQEEYFFYKEVMDFSCLGYKQLSGIENIIFYIIEKLDKGIYVNVCIDEYYLTIKRSYLKDHFVHETLIYGYDNNNKRFLGVGFDDNLLFNAYYIEYENFINAFNGGKVHYKNSAPYAENSAITFYSPRKYSYYNYDIGAFLNELNCYINSWGNRERVSIIAPPNANNIDLDNVAIKYGIDAVRVALDRVKRSAEGQILIDYRAIHLLAEHKKGMLTRLEFAALHRDRTGGTAELVESYRKIVKDFETIRIAAIEMLYTQNQNIKISSIQRIIAIIELSIEKEKGILTSIYEYYRQQANHHSLELGKGL